MSVSGNVIIKKWMENIAKFFIKYNYQSNKKMCTVKHATYCHK